MIKFENLNLFDALRQIVERNTKHYKTDLEYDIEAIQKNPDCDTWWWMSRECGTQIDKECDILCDGRPSSVKYFMDSGYEPLIYIIQITNRDETFVANLYHLKLDEAKGMLDHYKAACYPMYHYEDGTVLNERERRNLTCSDQSELGGVQAITYHPYDESMFKYKIGCLHFDMNKSSSGDFESHLASLK